MATKMNEFVGSKLTHGSFHQMSSELYSQVLVTTPAPLKLEALAPQYADAIGRMGKLIRRQTGYAETADVSLADANRDALWNSLYYCLHYLRALDPSHALYPHVKQLLPVFSPYTSIYKHELTKETSEIDGFMAAMSQKENADAAKALGITPLLGALTAENDKLKTSTTTRTSGAATRAAGLGEESTDQVRAEIVRIYRQMVARVNAVAELEGTDEVSKFIQEANGIAAHYETVMRNQGKKQGEKPEPTPEPTPAQQPTTTSEAEA